MASHVIGIDIGGSKVAAGLVDVETGELLLRRQHATQADRGGDHVARIVGTLLGDVRRDAAAQGSTPGGVVGIGICEIVDRQGALRSAGVIPWRGGDLQRELPAGLTIHLVSDVRAAALAEARFGGAKGVEHALYVSIGTGISAALLINGVPYGGAHGAACVLASAPVSHTCPQCGATGVITVEHVASGRGLTAHYTGAPDTPARAIIAAAGQGEPAALAVVTAATRLAGQAIGQLANCLDPELILIGGGLGCADGAYWQRLQPAIRAALWRDMPARPRIARGRLAADAGVIGAALAVGCGLH